VKKICQIILNVANAEKMLILILSKVLIILNSVISAVIISALSVAKKKLKKSELRMWIVAEIKEW